MALVDRLKTAIEKVLQLYEASEGDDISSADSVTITSIRDFMNNKEINAADLQEYLGERIRTMEGKFFSFFFFVNDLKDELSKILQNPAFSLSKCLKDDNKELKLFIRSVQRASAVEVVGDNYVSREQYEKDKLTLFKNLSDANTALSAENTLLKSELQAIEANNTKLVIQLKDERKRADHADAQINLLNLKLLAKNQEIDRQASDLSEFKRKMAFDKDEITLLKVEIDGLKRKSSINAGGDCSTPDALTPREIQSTPLTVLFRPK